MIKRDGKRDSLVSINATVKKKKRETGEEEENFVDVSFRDSCLSSSVCLSRDS